MSGSRDRAQSGDAAARRSGADLTPFRAIVESVSAEGGELVEQVSALIDRPQSFAAAQANATLTLWNWHIGRIIDVAVLHEERAGHDQELVASLAQQVSWTPFQELLPLVNDDARTFYVQETIAGNLGVRNLRRAIPRKAFERREITDSQIPQGSGLPTDAFRDTMLLDMFGLADTFLERDLEAVLRDDPESFLLEMCRGWTFVERQKWMTFDGEDYCLDLLFYSLLLRQLIAVELKIEKFKPSYTGQMDFYLEWLNRYEREPHEEAPIGLILCTEASRDQIELLELHKDGIVVVEYWTALPLKAELQERIQQIYRAAQERIARRQLTATDNTEEDED